MADDELQAEAVELLAQLIRFETVNPPGHERPAIEHLDRYLRAAGFQTEILAAREDRPNLVATLTGDAEGPTLCLLGHVDTVLADPEDWEHGPWSGDVAEGYLWGRGALDMKNQVAAEAVGAVSLARSGWRPRGTLKLVFVSDEETGGDLGAHWLTTEHPDAVRCDMLLNEGAGESFEIDGRRRYGVCVAEKGIFRFTITARGTAGHASLPRMGDNALLKLAPVLAALADPPELFALTEGPEAFLRGIGAEPDEASAVLARLAADQPALRVLLEPMFGVTLTPTMASASGKINVIPARAQLRVDCRVPPGLGEQAVRDRVAQVLGGVADGMEIAFTEQVIGNGSPVASPLMSAIDRWIGEHDEAAGTLPVILPGFSDSRWFRDAFPDCVAYGFFPQRHQSLLQATPLIHSANERIDIRDLGFATGFYRDIARELLG